MASNYIGIKQGLCLSHMGKFCKQKVGKFSEKEKMRKKSFW